MHVLAVLALAQMPWTSHLPQHGFALDFLRPKFEGGGTSTSSGTAFLSARFPTGGVFSLRLEVPYAHVGVSGSSSSTFGNPYFGVEATPGRVSYDLGFRPALASDDESATEIAFYSDISRIEAFIPHLATLSGRITYRNQTSTGVTLEAGAGPSAWIPTGGGDTEVILHHYASVGYRGAKVWTALGLGGIFIMTSDDGGLAEQTLYQLGASVGLASGPVRPALHAILPLDDELTSAVNYVIGLGVAVTIK